jgi:alpha-tubulin suppressor-like RCC1 family protein
MTSSFRFAAALLLGAALLAPGARAAAPSVSAGGSHSLAVHVDGTLRSWGDDSAGALGTGRSLQSLVPIQVPGLSGVTAIAAGDAHTVALKSDGTVWTWGRNAEGQLGDGTVNGRSTPAPVPGLTNVVAVAAGSIHTVALKSDGTVWTWGTNYVGQLGRDGNGSLTPQQVPGIANAVAIAAGWVTTFAVLRDGTVWAWGQDDNGQLGTGETAPQYQGIATPKQVVGLTGVVQVAAGVTHTLARRSDGTLAVWRQLDGQLRQRHDRKQQRADPRAEHLQRRLHRGRDLLARDPQRRKHVGLGIERRRPDRRQLYRPPRPGAHRRTSRRALGIALAAACRDRRQRRQRLVMGIQRPGRAGRRHNE